jgi:hypothetical protein
MTDIGRRLEAIKTLMADIAEDAHRIIGTIQLSLPVAESLIQRIAERAEQAKKIFAEEETHGRRNA